MVNTNPTNNRMSEETNTTTTANEAITALSTLGGFLKNKSTAILALVAGMYGYQKLPEGADGAPMPYTEIAYTALTLLAVIVLAPLLRVAVFNEAARYAESGKLDADLAQGKITPALIHYWFATAVCYAAAIVCLGTISK